MRFDRDPVGVYRHVMLVDGNDERGIDVGIMTKTGFDILDIRSHVGDRCGSLRISAASSASSRPTRRFFDMGVSLYSRERTGSS